MENIPITPSKNDRSKQVIFIVLFIVALLCAVVLFMVYGVYFGLATVAKNQELYVVTEQANATATAVNQATQVASYDLFDDFEDNDNEWEQGDEDNEYWHGKISVQDGIYIWNVKGFYGNEAISSWRGYKDNKSVEDFDLSVDAKLSTPDAKRLCYAIAFRSNPDALASGGYEFHVCDDGQFYVGYYESNMSNIKVLSPWTQSSAIHSGDWNTLAVSARGDHFTLSINNIVVCEFTDASSPSGEVYLMIRYYDPVPGIIMFDNFGLQLR